MKTKKTIAGKKGRPPSPPEIDLAEKIKQDCIANPRFYSLPEVIEMIGITKVTAHRWLRAGRFTGVLWAANGWLFEAGFQIREGRSDGRIAEMSKRLLSTSEGEQNAN